MAFSFLKTCAVSLLLFSTLLFFLLTTPHQQLQIPSLFFSSSFPLIPRRSLLHNSSTIADLSCSNSKSDGLFDYSSLHLCLFNKNKHISIPSLSLVLVLHFYILIKTAQDHFSVVTTKLSSHLNLSPSMAAVTLLALGNGAPDVFASLAAVRGGQYRTGFGAILSAGTFVSAFVVGFVAIYAAPFSLSPAPFVRDVMFYLVAALFLFYVYLSAEIFLWQAVGFVGFYLFFVGIVFWMDLGMGGGKRKGGVEMSFVGDVEGQRGMTMVAVPDTEIGQLSSSLEKGKPSFGLQRALGMVSLV